MTSKVSRRKLDLTKVKSGVIFQQINRLSVEPKHLAYALGKAFPHGNAYHARKRITPSRNCATLATRDELGTITICLPTQIKKDDEKKSGPVIINLVAQAGPGPVDKHYANLMTKYDEKLDETYDDRLKWFESCLNEAFIWIQSADHDIERTLYIPEKIGCGAAGGSIAAYRKLLDPFVDQVSKLDWSVVWVQDPF